MQSKTNIMRWVLVIPCAIAGWYAALITGLLLYNLVDSLCPPESLVSGICHTAWSSQLKHVIIVFAASLSAILAIVFSVLIAPGRRPRVAQVIYFCGCLVAAYFVYRTSEWGAFAGAIASGTLCLILTLQFLNKNH